MTNGFMKPATESRGYRSIKKPRSLFAGLLVLFVFILMFGFSSAYAADGFNIKQNLSIGFIKSGTNEVGALSWNPDFKLGPWKIGLALNIPMSPKKTIALDQIVFRYAEYNDGQKGLRYGGITGLTWGRGLLMKNYSSYALGSIIPSNQQMTLMGYYSYDMYKAQALGTWSHIYGLRLTEQINPWLVLGQSYITDSDGVLVKQTSGTDKQFPSVTGVGVDATCPLPFNFDAYAEAASLLNHGNGLTFGLGWDYDILAMALSFDAGYRAIDKGFAPGYFNAEYESNPIDLTSFEASGKSKNGYTAELNALYGKIFKFRAFFEKYNENPTGSLNGNATLYMDEAYADFYYSQPNFVDFRSLDLQQGAVLNGEVGYKVNQFTTLVLHYKKYYDGGLAQVVESTYYEMKFSM